MVGAMLLRPTIGYTRLFHAIRAQEPTVPILGAKY